MTNQRKKKRLVSLAITKCYKRLIKQINRAIRFHLRNLQVYAFIRNQSWKGEVSPRRAIIPLIQRAAIFNDILVEGFQTTEQFKDKYRNLKKHYIPAKDKTTDVANKAEEEDIKPLEPVPLEESGVGPRVEFLNSTPEADDIFDNCSKMNSPAFDIVELETSWNKERLEDIEQMRHENDELCRMVKKSTDNFDSLMDKLLDRL